MKKFLFSLAMVAGFMTVNAQTVIWSDDFEDEDISDWTIYDEDGDGNTWGDLFYVQDQNQNPVSPISLISRSWQQVALTPDNWVVSPAIDLTGASGAITLNWKVQAAAAAWDLENYSVYVATAADLASLEASDVTFTETYDDPANAGTQYDRDLDLSDFAGQIVYVAFRHHDVTDQDWLSIDDVSVEAETLMAVSDLNKNVSAVYPNPVIDNFNINLSSKFNASNVFVTITDLAGRTVKTFGAADSYNVSELPKGVYVVKITDGQNTETKKIVKK
ncbi:T9SS-dependent choice-of-anchor J family protein [Moheibacter sediminis]|uniref:Por secretion system C-terminal sorting domain-containing protein n=1 Tax=Moheibacter sediminis TaxID=1434700 RepID=A0A1W1ZTN7_9FLAO|nr:choice-of-anchor J domain-containing protein [Moheibacter sediminis]SMC51820.1 Por secretion system C-terminal sorting domain-containing protein [Moheibacter sediminis]